MLKKILKKILLCIVTIYYTLSLMYTIYNFSENALKLKEYEFPGGTTMHTETIDLEENVSIRSLNRQSFYAGKGVILLNNVEIFIISVLLGSFLGLVISSKEYSKVRVILKFILGNILFNLIFSIIYYYNFNYLHYRIYEVYIIILKNCFILYIIIYLVIYFISALIDKLIVNEMNKKLNN